jgi:hypothetical protein
MLPNIRKRIVFLGTFTGFSPFVLLKYQHVGKDEYGALVE